MHDASTFRGRNSTKHHGKRFKPNTYAYLSKIKDAQTSKGRKASQETKNLKDTFYLIFLTQTLTLRHSKLSKIIKSTLLKFKTLTLSQKLNQTKLILKQKAS
jgi:hypothetical protein